MIKMSWKDIIKEEPVKCGYCEKDMSNVGIHGRHSSRFPEVENPICSKCNFEIEIPRRFAMYTGGSEKSRDWQKDNR
tara:strand:+ start:255 stop:485 length:231 start_codon:yes stop_codon:yes gene_type:complete